MGLWDDLYVIGGAEELQADFEEAGIIAEPMPESSGGGGGGAGDAGDGEPEPQPEDDENKPHKGEKLTNKQKFENRLYEWKKKKAARADKKEKDSDAKAAKKEKKDKQTEISRANKQTASADSKRKVFNKDSNDDRKDAAQQAEADVTPSQESYNDLMKMGAGVHATTQLGYGRDPSEGSGLENQNGLTDAAIAGQDSRLYDLEHP